MSESDKHAGAMPFLDRYEWTVAEALRWALGRISTSLDKGEYYAKAENALRAALSAPSAEREPFDMMAELKARMGIPKLRRWTMWLSGEGLNPTEDEHGAYVLYADVVAALSSEGETFASWIERELPRATGYERDLAETVWLGALASRSHEQAPIAWRYRERLLGGHSQPTPNWGSWHHVGFEPQGPASDILQIEPLYSASTSAKGATDG